MTRNYFDQELQDRAIGLPPLNSTLARRLMEQTRIFGALKGIRGRRPVDLPALENVLVRFSQLVAEQRWIKEIDVNPLFASAFGKMRDLLLELLPEYARQGKTYVNIAFGCTGGRHRSVYTAEQMAQALRDGGFSPTVLHRNLGSRAAGLVEGSPNH